MGRETPRASIIKITLIDLLVIILFFLWTPANGFSIQEPEYYQKWLETLKTGIPDEKIYALSYTPASLDCCKLQKDPAALNLFLTALKHKDHRVREAAAASMRHIESGSKECCKKTEMVPALIGALKDKDLGSGISNKVLIYASLYG